MDEHLWQFSLGMLLVLAGSVSAQPAPAAPAGVIRFPADKATGINPDTHLVITNITFLGEDREKVQVFNANNEVFNPHPPNVATNEWPGTFPSRRAAFMGDHSTGIHLVNFTVETTARGQAEGLLLVGGQTIVSNVTIRGSGDALQVNDSVYLTDSLIVGDGDTILGRGPAFFNNCELNSRGVYMWTRNTSANHGNVFLNCRFQTFGNGVTEIARAPTNGGRNYPNAEVVLVSDSAKTAGFPLYRLCKTRRSGNRIAVRTPCEIVSTPMVGPITLGFGYPAGSSRALLRWP
jgi:hypothetical protein